MAILALGPSLAQCVFVYAFWVGPTAIICGTLAPIFGLVAMIVSWTATCRAYRRCGIVSVAVLYTASLIAQILSLVPAFWEGNVWGNCGQNRSSYYSKYDDDDYADYYSYYQRTKCNIFLRLAIPAILLWFGCAICTALMARREDPTKHGQQIPDYPGQQVVSVETVIEHFPDGSKVIKKTITQADGSRMIQTTNETQEIPAALPLDPEEA